MYQVQIFSTTEYEYSVLQSMNIQFHIRYEYLVFQQYFLKEGRNCVNISNLTYNIVSSKHKS